MDDDIELMHWLRQWADGDPRALDKLLPMVYGELRRLARRHLRNERPGHTLQGTGLVHEVFLRIAEGAAVPLQSRAQFFGLASTLMRHVLVDHARARSAGKRGGGQSAVPLDEELEAAIQISKSRWSDEAQRVDLLALDQALRRLERIDPQQSRLVEMRFFGGLGVEETAEALRVSSATVKREWRSARAWLLREMGSPALPTPPSGT